MNYPLISEYVEAIKAAEDNFDQLKHLRPVLGEDGEPVMTSGNFAVVFKMKDEQTGKLHAVKCFLKEQEGRAEAYRQIAEELEFVSSTFLTPIKYLDKEMFVDSANSEDSEFPVLLMDWVEGQTLDKYIREHIDDQYELSLLAYQFSRLAMWLMPQPFAHGDLKPDNILVKEDGTLVLVDYDGMYVPAMKGQKARELGSPDFQHPNRKDTDFDDHIDDFSFACILLSLKAIALQPSLLGEYGASDRLLFSRQDYHNLSDCPLLEEFYQYLAEKDFINLYSAFLSAVANKTLPSSFYKLFQISRYSDTNKDENVSSELKKLIADAQRGNSSAQYELAGSYHFGYNVGKDYKKAIYWYSKAAKKNKEAMNNLGCLYDKGLGVKKNPEKAASLFRLSAERRCVQGMYNLANCYEEGHGVIQDISIAILWYRKIVEECHSGLGCSKACYKLALFYRIGLGVSPNKDEYDKYLEIAKRNEINGSWASSQKEEGELPNPNVTSSDFQDSFVDDYGVVYSKDGNRLLQASSNLVNYEIRIGTKIVCKEAFTKCANSLVSVTIPKTLIAIAPNAFAGCNLLSDVHFECDTLLCMIGGWAFSGCGGLKKVHLPNHITYIGPGAFSYCDSLQEISLPLSLLDNFYYHFPVDGMILDMPYNYKDYFIFEGCKSLKLVRVPKNSIEKFKIFIPNDRNIQITDKPDLCSFASLLARKKTKSPSDNTDLCDEHSLKEEWTDEYGVKYSADKTHLIKAPSDIVKYSIREGTKYINNRAFDFCVKLVSITIPESVICIGDSSFGECHNLSEIKNLGRIETVGHFSFAGCRSLKSIKFNEGLVKMGGSVFKGCVSLHSVYIPSSVDSFGDLFPSNGIWLHANRVTTFDYCDSLKDIIIPVGSRRKFEKLLPNYKDKLVDENRGWRIKETRPFSPDEIAAVARAEVVPSQYGNSVCFFMNSGGQTYIPLLSTSSLTVGESVDLKTAKLVTLCREGKDDIYRVIE